MNMNEIIIALIGLAGGGLGQYIISGKLMPKKERKEADQQFIETLLQRISNLEGRLDEQSKQLTMVMEENARLKVEMEYLRKENESYKKQIQDLTND
jgi:predicted RNase H-like nuclease (RuvC/YqgF family)